MMMNDVNVNGGAKAKGGIFNFLYLSVRCTTTGHLFGVGSRLR